VIAFFTIRCPACGSRWMMHAAKQHSSRWLRWLLTLQECPDCGSRGSPPNNRLQRAGEE
jgi:DNA-directed RNA polymerase subunit RPC12/RpoP